MGLQRVIGEHTGKERGPLLVCFAGMHGNEPAGVQALEILFTLIENEPNINPDFRFKGRMIGLRGNLKALRNRVRYLNHDLNRLWTVDNIRRILQTPKRELEAEDEEISEILGIIHAEIADYQPNKLIILDLHTTTADGGIFTIACDDPESVEIGTELHAPVVKGLLNGIYGTTLHYFNSENMGIPTVAVTFESGQHEDPLSVNRAIAAIINCMRTTGLVKAQDVENRHDALLIEFSRNLPKVA
ncbi:MAG: succinylglutamate desuccinylase/aspartoacylase family protein, partial [Bacteroidota bacterium]